MLEDLFKVVKFRAENDNRADKKNKVSIPRDLLFQCPRCGSSMFMDDFVGASKVCTSCGYHARLTAQERLDLTIDKGTFEEYEADMTSKNPIQFDGYEKKIADLRKKPGLRDAILTANARFATSIA